MNVSCVSVALSLTSVRKAGDCLALVEVCSLSLSFLVDYLCNSFLFSSECFSPLIIVQPPLGIFSYLTCVQLSLPVVYLKKNSGIFQPMPNLLDCFTLIFEIKTSIELLQQCSGTGQAKRWPFTTSRLSKGQRLPKFSDAYGRQNDLCGFLLKHLVHAVVIS